VRVMAKLPSGVLLGNKFLVGGLGMTMNLRSGWGKLTLPLGDRPLTYSGRIDTQVKVASAEELAAVIGEDIDGIIGTLDLTHFGNGPADAERLRTLLTKYKQVFVPTTAVTKGPDFDIKLKPDAALLSCPPFRKSRVEKAAKSVELAKMLERGILEKSTPPFATNNVTSSCRRSLFRTARVVEYG
jgi:hypothetical protein